MCISLRLLLDKCYQPAHGLLVHQHAATIQKFLKSQSDTFVLTYFQQVFEEHPHPVTHILQVKLLRTNQAI